MDKKIEQLVKELHQTCENNSLTMVLAITDEDQMETAAYGDALIQIFALNKLKNSISKEIGLPISSLDFVTNALIKTEEKHENIEINDKRMKELLDQLQNK